MSSHVNLLDVGRPHERVLNGLWLNVLATEQHESVLGTTYSQSTMAPGGHAANDSHGHNQLVVSAAQNVPAY